MLIADLGNSAVKLQQVDPQGHFISLLRLPYSAGWQHLLADTLEKHHQSKLVYAAVCQLETVVAFERVCRDAGIKPKRLHTQAYGCGVINSYNQPERLGVDRWLAMVAVRAKTKQPVLIIDFGTAVTVDLLDEFGQHKGGWIAPGLDLQQESLIQRAPHVFQQKVSSEYAFANQTEQALANAALASMVGLVNEAQRIARKSLHTNIPVRVFATGGNAGTIMRWTELTAELHPDLVLEGIYLAGCDENIAKQ